MLAKSWLKTIAIAFSIFGFPLFKVVSPVFFKKPKPMMNFNRINNIVGWIICIIACGTYILTSEATGSLWDTGEFISSAFKLQIPHPPGAPLFVLLGRFFII